MPSLNDEASSSLSPPTNHRLSFVATIEDQLPIQPNDQQSDQLEAATVGDTKDEQMLAEQCHSSFYCRRVKFVKVLMTLMSVKLAAEPATDCSRPLGSGGGDQKPERQSVRQVFRPLAALPEYCPKLHKPDASWISRIIWPHKVALLSSLYLHYVSVKFLPLSILLLKHHLILAHLKPSVQPEAQRTNSCALNEDLHFDTPAYWAEFEQLKSLDSWLKFLGIGMVSLPELSVPSTFLLAILPLSYHHMFRLYISIHGHRTDTLCFLLDPLGERRRICDELREMVHELILSQSEQKKTVVLESSKNALRNGLQVFGLRRVSRQQLASGDNNGSSECPELAGSRRRLLNDQARRRCYLQTLITGKKLEHVDPYIVTAEWHRTLWRLVDVLLTAAMCFYITLAIFVVLGVMLYDLCNDTRLRLEMVECTKWRPQGGTRIAALDHLYLDELKSEEQLDAYKAHDGSILSFLKLALLVESTNYFSLRRLLSWCEHLLADYVLGLEWLLSAGLHIISTIEKIAWLHRLDQQVDYAARQAAVHAHLAHRFGPKQENDERLLDTLTIVYLNYELFRRQQEEYLTLTDRITIWLTLLAMMSCLIIYSSGLSLGNSSPVLIFSLCSLLLVTINTFLIASSYRMKQMENIMTKATRILAHCSSGPMQLSCPVELWRRQVVAFEESRCLYASRLFWIPVNYRTVISLNGYAIGLLLILLKPDQGFSPL